VIGAGQMGTGIGLVASRVAGIEVKFVEPHDSALVKSRAFVNDWCDKEIKKNRLTEDEKRDVIGRISYHSQVKDLHDIDFAVEVRYTDE
jgi:3-hydroxybutyryl-CoA dehydrogenase